MFLLSFQQSIFCQVKIMFDGYFHSSPKFALTPAAIYTVHTYRLGAVLIVIGRREIISGIYHDAIQPLLHILIYISIFFGHIGHSERGYFIIKAAIRIFEMDMFIVVHHILAELIALLAHHKGGLQSYFPLSLVITFHKCGKSRLRDKVVKTLL